MKVLILLVLFTACKTEKGKIISRQRDIRHEELTMMREYYNKHREKPRINNSRKAFDESIELTSKMFRLRKEHDSLQKVLDVKYAEDK